VTAPAEVPPIPESDAGAAEAAEQRRGLLAMTLVIVGFSIGSPFVRKVGAPGPVVAFWRMLFTATAWQLLLFRQGKRVTWAMVRSIGPLGLVFAANLTCFFTAATKTRIANVEMIGSMAPLVVFPIAAIVYGERVRAGALALGLPAFAGVALVLFGAPHTGARSSWTGNLLALAALGLWTTYLLGSRRVRGRYTTTEFMATVSIVTVPVIFPIALAEGNMTHVRPLGWVLIVALTITAGTGAHGLLQWAQERLPISTISMMQVAQPALAIMWAFLLLHESARPIQLVGVAVVLVCLALFTLATTRWANGRAMVRRPAIR